VAVAVNFAIGEGIKSRGRILERYD